MSDLYKELKDSQAFTVGELIEKLQKLPSEAKICCVGSDIGGYDTCWLNYVAVQVVDKHEEGATVELGGLEFEAWNAQKEGKLTYEQFTEFES